MLFLNLNSEERKKKKEKRRKKREEEKGRRKKGEEKKEEGDGLHFKGAPEVRQPATARSAENF